MGLEVENKNYYEFFDEINVQEETSNIAYLIIPFSTLFKNENPPDIYTGKLAIPFQEKDSEFQQILMNEFLVK
ncbi:MAG: hypothetical protein ACFFCE_11335 [Promethearchaeota archaeon]